MPPAGLRRNLGSSSGNTGAHLHDSPTTCSPDTDQKNDRPTDQPSKCAPVEELRCVGADPTHNARHGESTDGGAHGLHASFLSLQHIFAISLVSSRADDLAFGLFSSVMMTCLIVQGLSTVQPSHSQKAIV